MESNNYRAKNVNGNIHDGSGYAVYRSNAVTDNRAGRRLAKRTKKLGE